MDKIIEACKVLKDFCKTNAEKCDGRCVFYSTCMDERKSAHNLEELMNIFIADCETAKRAKSIDYGTAHEYIENAICMYFVCCKGCPFAGDDPCVADQLWREV